MTARSCEFSDPAETDLEQIALYRLGQSTSGAVLCCRDQAHCALLAENPAICRVREEYGAGVRVAVHGRYLIFYAERTAGTVMIERMLHGARHLDWV